MTNLSQFGPEVWAVWGVASDFGPCTSCNSGNSVLLSTVSQLVDGISKIATMAPLICPWCTPNPTSPIAPTVWAVTGLLQVLGAPHLVICLFLSNVLQRNVALTVPWKSDMIVAISRGQVGSGSSDFKQFFSVKNIPMFLQNNKFDYFCIL